MWKGIGIVLAICAFTGIGAYLAIQTILRVTCDPAETPRDFDAVITVDQTWTEAYREETPPPQFTMDVRVSGEDAHWTQSTTDGVIHGEYMVKDRLAYKKGEEGWTRHRGIAEAQAFIPHFIDSRPVYMDISSEHVLCAIEDEDFWVVTKIRFQELDEYEPVRVTWEYRPTIKGHIYWSHQIFEPVEGEDWKTEYTAKIYDVGEPNVIELPEGTELYLDDWERRIHERLMKGK